MKELFGQPNIPSDVFTHVLLDSTRKRNHTALSLSDVLHLAERLWGHRCCHKREDAAPLCGGPTPHRVHVSAVVCAQTPSPARLSAAVSDAAMNTGAHARLQCFRLLWTNPQKRVPAGSTGISRFRISGEPLVFGSPASSAQGSLSSTWWLGDSHTDQCEGTLRCVVAFSYEVSTSLTADAETTSPHVLLPALPQPSPRTCYFQGCLSSVTGPCGLTGRRGLTPRGPSPARSAPGPLGSPCPCGPAREPKLQGPVTAATSKSTFPWERPYFSPHVPAGLFPVLTRHLSHLLTSGTHARTRMHANIWEKGTSASQGFRAPRTQQCEDAGVRPISCLPTLQGCTGALKQPQETRE